METLCTIASVLVLASGWIACAICYVVQRPMPMPPKCDDSCFEP